MKHYKTGLFCCFLHAAFILRRSAVSFFLRCKRILLFQPGGSRFAARAIKENEIFVAINIARGYIQLRYKERQKTKTKIVRK